MSYFKHFFRNKWHLAKKIIKFVCYPFWSFVTKPDFRNRVLYAYAYKKNTVDNQMLFYESYHGSSISCSPLAVYLNLKMDTNFQEFKHIWVCNDRKNLPEMITKNVKNTILVKRHSFAYFRYLSKAKYLINNSTFPSYFTKKEEQVYINTWHGTPLKKMMKDVANATKQHRNILRNFAAVDYLVSPNQHTEEILIHSSGIGELYNGFLLNTGLPRVDFINPQKREKVAKQLQENYQCDINGKVVILYAPTWRGKPGGGTTKTERLDISEQILNHVQSLMLQLPANTILLLKVHNYMQNFFIRNGSKWANWIIQDDIETNELLSAVDILITDYSSIFFDFLHTRKPILFFAFDEETYLQDRGLYFSLNELPGAICHTTEELIEQIRLIDTHSSIYEKKYHVQTEQFLKLYCRNDDGNATKRLIDTIFYRKNLKLARRMEQRDRKQILVYPGTLKNNGITSSFINLTYNIDYKKVDLIMLWNGAEDEERERNFQKIHPNVKVLYRENLYNFTIAEYLQHTFFIKGFARKIKIRLHKEKYYREFRRVCGDIRIDAAIEFNGYSANYSLFFSAIPSKKIIFLHSHMVADMNRKVDGKRPHFIGLSTVFTMYRYYDEVVSVSELTKDINQKTLARYLNGKQIKVVHNTLHTKLIFDSLKEINPALLVKEKQKNFVTMGRISSEKDHEKLIYAFARLRKEFEDVELYIIGDGPLRHSLEKLVEKLSLQHHICFTGHLDNPCSVMNQCDCFVLSSNHEGQPMVLLEALILGKPIISTDIPGARSVIGDQYGELVENSVDGLVNGMRKYLNDLPRQKPFDYQKYNAEAMQMFYKCCGII